MVTSPSDLDIWFSYHEPEAGDKAKYEAIRAAGRMLAQTILDNTPPSIDQYESIRRVREAVMTANAAIACKGR